MFVEFKVRFSWTGATAPHLHHFYYLFKPAELVVGLNASGCQISLL